MRDVAQLSGGLPKYLCAQVRMQLGAVPNPPKYLRQSCHLWGVWNIGMGNEIILFYFYF